MEAKVNEWKPKRKKWLCEPKERQRKEWKNQKKTRRNSCRYYNKHRTDEYVIEYMDVLQA